MAKGDFRRHRVVILGAGFAGLAAAKDLCRADEVSVTVIDRSSTHTYHPYLYEVATGLMHGHDLVGAAALTRGASFDYEHLLKGWGCGFVHAVVTGVDHTRRQVTTDDGEIYSFDTLVVAFGFDTDYFDIPRLAERSLRMNSLLDALALRERLMDFVARKRLGKEVALRVLVGGGGATGVETAAELANFFQHRQRMGELHSGDWNVRLVEASPRLMSMLPPHLSSHVLRRLEKLGVKVMLDTCIKRVEDQHVILAPRPLKSGESQDALLCEFRAESERAFEAEVLIWCGGVRGSASSAVLGLPLDRKGRLSVDPTLRVSGTDGVYAAGDCASLVNPADGKPVPALAQAAIEMGHVVASNILHTLRGQKLFAMPFHPYPTVIPLGGKNALAAVGYAHPGGFVGWCVRQATALFYYLSILPPAKATFTFIRGVFSYTRND